MNDKELTAEEEEALSADFWTANNDSFTSLIEVVSLHSKGKSSLLTATDDQIYGKSTLQSLISRAALLSLAPELRDIADALSLLIDR